MKLAANQGISVDSHATQKVDISVGSYTLHFAWQEMGIIVCMVIAC